MILIPDQGSDQESDPKLDQESDQRLDQESDHQHRYQAWIWYHFKVFLRTAVKSGKSASVISSLSQCHLDLPQAKKKSYSLPRYPESAAHAGSSPDKGGVEDCWPGLGQQVASGGQSSMQQPHFFTLPLSCVSFCSDCAAKTRNSHIGTLLLMHCKLVIDWCSQHC